MKNEETLTIIGHEVSIKPSIKDLNGVKYDSVIDHINQSILDGNDAGSFESFDTQYEWEINHHQ